MAWRTPRALRPCTFVLRRTAPAVAAAHALRLGPVEFVPYASVGVRHHTNVYVANDDEESTLEGNGAHVGGLVVDLNGGISLRFKPIGTNMQLQSRHFFFDAYFKPGLTFFPAASRAELLSGQQRPVRRAT